MRRPPTAVGLHFPTASPDNSISDRPPVRRLFNPVWLFAAILVVVVVLIVGNKIYSWHHNKAPFGPEAVDAHLVGLQVINPNNVRGSNVAAALRALGDQPKAASFEFPARHQLWQYVVARIDLAAHPAPDGSQYWVVVIDNRTHEVVSLSGDPKNGSDSSGDGAGSGWDGGMANFASKYSWLAPLAPSDAGSDDGGDVFASVTTVGFVPGPARSLPFVGPDMDEPSPITHPAKDLTVALLFMGPDRQAWWAERLN